MRTFVLAALTSLITTIPAFADSHAKQIIIATDQSVANGVVSASKVIASENGWLVAHIVDEGNAPGFVIGYAPIRAGETNDVAIILTEIVAPGDQLMLMVHDESSGKVPGFYEYTLGS